MLREIGVPIAGAISGDGRIEGGDVTWLDQKTLAVGRGYRTNDEGIRQLRELLGDGVEVVVVPLPHWRGPADVFHLMSMISPVAEDLAVVYSPLLPVPFREFLLGARHPAGGGARRGVRVHGLQRAGRGAADLPAADRESARPGNAWRRPASRCTSSPATRSAAAAPAGRPASRGR